MDHILTQIINLKALVDTNPELFNFKKLSNYNKCELLRYEYEKYSPIILPLFKSLNDRVFAVITLKTENISHDITFNDNELKKISGWDYSRLLELDFERYINKDAFLNLSKNDQNNLFTKDPEWFMTTMGYLPALTSDSLVTISRRRPKFIDEYITDISKYSTTAEFWNNMIKYDKKYMSLFLEHNKSVINKTDVRRVCRLHPSIITLLTVDHLGNTKLTTKEWVLLINTIKVCEETVSVIDKKGKAQKKKQFKLQDWKPSPELEEIFKLDLMSEFLSGKSKSSRVFQNAMSNVFVGEDPKIKDDETEEV